MSSRAIVAAFFVLTLAGCDGKPKKAQPAASESPAMSEQTPAPTERARPSISCFNTPLANTVEEGLKAAMLQIYGADEIGVRIDVLSMTPSDCRSFVVRYRASGSEATAPLALGDDGRWYLTLYKKRYFLP